MELCAGGELFDQLVTRRQFSEGDAAALLRPLLDVVAYAHSKHVVHRCARGCVCGGGGGICELVVAPPSLGRLVQRDVATARSGSRLLSNAHAAVPRLRGLC
jgi:hypothetical protein